MVDISSIAKKDRNRYNSIALNLISNNDGKPITPEKIDSFFPNTADKQKQIDRTIDVLTTCGLIGENGLLTIDDTYKFAQYDNDIFSISEKQSLIYNDFAIRANDTDIEQIKKAIDVHDLSQLPLGAKVIIDGYEIRKDEDNRVIAKPIAHSSFLNNLSTIQMTRDITVDKIDLTDTIMPSYIITESPEWLYNFDVEQGNKILHLCEISNSNFSEIESQIDRIEQREMSGNSTPEVGESYIDEGVVYTFENTNNSIKCRAIPIKDDAVIKDSFAGIPTHTDSEHELVESVADSVLDDKEQDVVYTIQPLKVEKSLTEENDFVGENIYDMSAHTEHVTNSPYMGDGKSTVYEPNNMFEDSVHAAQKMNDMEKARINAEIQYNVLCNRRAQLKSQEYNHSRSLVLNFLRNILFRPLRYLWHAITRAITTTFLGTDLTKYSPYETEVRKLNQQIKDIKEKWYVQEKDISDYIKDKDIHITEHEEKADEKTENKKEQEPSISQKQTQEDKHQQEEQTKSQEESKQEETKKTQSRPKQNIYSLIKTEVASLSPIGYTMFMDTIRQKEENGRVKYNNVLTLSDGITELKFDANQSKLKSLTSATISEKQLSDLSERVCVAQNIAKIKTSTPIIDENSWTRKKEGQKSNEEKFAALLCEPTDKAKTFYFGGIKTEIQTSDYDITISSLGSKKTYSISAFKDNPLQALNIALENSVIDRRITYMAEKLPQTLKDTSVFKANKNYAKYVTIENSNVQMTVGGRPIINIPIQVKNPIDENSIVPVNIKIDTNTGKFDVSYDAENYSVSRRQEAVIESISKDIRNLYSSQLLSFATPQQIYCEIFDVRTKNEVDSFIGNMPNNSQRNINIYGINVDISKSENGSVEIKYTDSQNVFENFKKHYSAIDGVVEIPLGAIAEFRKYGCEEMQKLSKMYEMDEVKAKQAEEQSYDGKFGTMSTQHNISKTEDFITSDNDRQNAELDAMDFDNMEER